METPPAPLMLASEAAVLFEYLQQPEISSEPENQKTENTKQGLVGTNDLCSTSSKLDDKGT